MPPPPSAESSDDMDPAIVSMVDKLQDMTSDTNRNSKPKTNPGILGLIPEILPPVIAQLDPSNNDNLAMLLKLQRLSKKTWKLVNPIVYRDLTIKDWSKALAPPDGVSFPSLMDCDAVCKKVASLTRSHCRYLIRKRTFAYVKTLRIHSFPNEANGLVGSLIL